MFKSKGTVKCGVCRDCIEYGTIALQDIMYLHTLKGARSAKIFWEEIFMPKSQLGGILYIFPPGKIDRLAVSILQVLRHGRTYVINVMKCYCSIHAIKCISGIN